MKSLRPFLWATIGGMVVAILLPIFSRALDDYVLPSGSTGQRTELLTLGPNRDESLRSHFSGTTAPIAPAPLAGQLFFNTSSGNYQHYNGTSWGGISTGSIATPWAKGDLPTATAYEDEANVFTLSQKIQMSFPSLTLDETGSNLSAVSYTSGGAGRVDLTYNNTLDVFSIDDSGVGPVIQWDLSTKDMKTDVGSNHTVTTACAAGYTRVGLWCMDTDGNLSAIRVASASEGSYTTNTVIGSTTKLAMIRTQSSLLQDGTGEGTELASCIIPGDSSETACRGGAGHQAAWARADLANEFDIDIGMTVVRTDSSGQVKTRCDMGGGPVTSLTCSWRIVGYMD